MLPVGAAYPDRSRHANRVQLTHDLGAGLPPTRRSGIAVWGLGVQYRYFNMRGHCVPSFVSEQGIGRGAPSTQPLTTLLNALNGGAGGNDYTTYAASASYITSAAVGVVLESTSLSLFDVRSESRSNPSVALSAHVDPHTSCARIACVPRTRLALLLLARFGRQGHGGDASTIPACRWRRMGAARLGS